MIDAKEEVRARLNIEDVIGDYVQLKRAGRNFKGLSPFTNEKSPSFIVSPEKQIWHDFSSGRGGDIFTFIMESEGLDFKGALELLARKAGVDIEQISQSTSPGQADFKQRLYQVLQQSAQFYQKQLTQHHEALRYVREKRKFEKQTIIDFQLGYSPDSLDPLTSFLLARKFTPNELQKAGVSTMRRNGLSDMFRGRIMVPLRDVQGKVIGFTARLLKPDDNAPKYINTPATVLYDKSRHIYGLDSAKQEIRKLGFVVVAEGNLDVIASHQAGFKNVVATAGTAMTTQQFLQLKRFTGDVRLAFDADKAGRSATERAIPLAQSCGISLQIITIPSGKDPDELIQQDPSLWEQTIKQPQDAIQWLIDCYSSELDISTATGKRRFTDIVLPLVASVKDSVEQDYYAQKIAGIIEVGKEAVLQKLQVSQNSPQKRLKQVKKNSSQSVGVAEAEKLAQHFLGIMLLYPSLRNFLDDLPLDVFSGDANELADILKECVKNKQELPPTESLKKFDNYVKMVTLLVEELYQKTDNEELSYQTDRLQKRLVTEYIKKQKSELAEKLTNANQKDEQVLLMQARHLDELRKKFLNE